MHIQWFVKGISGAPGGLKKEKAFDMIVTGDGIYSNWWRNKHSITSIEVYTNLTEGNLDRHLHDYDNFGPDSPFISLTAGCVERDNLLKSNRIYSAIDIALDFATEAGKHDGALFYGWVLASLNKAIPMRAVAEPVRDLNTYRRWSPYQLEGELTAKVHIPANQIYRIQWWTAKNGKCMVDRDRLNPIFADPSPITNVRMSF
jgi:hypothetical protein